MTYYLNDNIKYSTLREHPLRNRGLTNLEKVRRMTVIPDYDPIEVALRVEARDIVERTIREEQARQHAEDQTLSALDLAIAAEEDVRRRLERLEQWKALFLVEMNRRDWPEFHNEQVVTGVRHKRFGRTEPIIEQRTVRRWVRRGITTRSEYVDCSLSNYPLRMKLLPDERRFDIGGFEHFFLVLFKHYHIDPTP